MHDYMVTEIIPVSKDKHEKESKKVWKKHNEEIGEKFDKKSYYFEINADHKNAGYIQIDIGMGVAYLNDLIIKSEHRNNKLGHKAMEFFEIMARKHDCHKMRIKTCPERSPAAFHLYEKFGFIREATLKNDYFNKKWVILSKFIGKK